MEDDHPGSDQARRLIGLAAGLSVVLLAVAASLLFALSDGGPDAGTIGEVGALHLLPPGDSPPRPRRAPGADPGPPGAPPGETRVPPGPRGTPGEVTTRIAEMGWRPLAVRSDSVHGYAVETMVYTRAGRRLGHSVVVGEPPAPAEVRRLGRDGVLLRGFEERSLTIVVWSREGITEVLAGEGLARADLFDLAVGPA